MPPKSKPGSAKSKVPTVGEVEAQWKSEENKWNRERQKLQTELRSLQTMLEQTCNAEKSMRHKTIDIAVERSSQRKSASQKEAKLRQQVKTLNEAQQKDEEFQAHHDNTRELLSREKESRESDLSETAARLSTAEQSRLAAIAEAKHKAVSDLYRALLGLRAAETELEGKNVQLRQLLHNETASSSSTVATPDGGRAGCGLLTKDEYCVALQHKPRHAVVVGPSVTSQLIAGTLAADYGTHVDFLNTGEFEEETASGGDSVNVPTPSSQLLHQAAESSLGAQLASARGHLHEMRVPRVRLNHPRTHHNVDEKSSEADAQRRRVSNKLLRALLSDLCWRASRCSNGQKQLVVVISAYCVPGSKGRRIQLLPPAMNAAPLPDDATIAVDELVDVLMRQPLQNNVFLTLDCCGEDGFCFVGTLTSAPTYLRYTSAATTLSPSRWAGLGVHGVLMCLARLRALHAMDDTAAAHYAPLSLPADLDQVKDVVAVTLKSGLESFPAKRQPSTPQRLQYPVRELDMEALGELQRDSNNDNVEDEKDEDDEAAASSKADSLQLVVQTPSSHTALSVKDCIARDNSVWLQGQIFFPPDNIFREGPYADMVETFLSSVISRASGLPYEEKRKSVRDFVQDFFRSLVAKELNAQHFHFLYGAVDDRPLINTIEVVDAFHATSASAHLAEHLRPTKDELQERQGFVGRLARREEERGVDMGVSPYRLSPTRRRRRNSPPPSSLSSTMMSSTLTSRCAPSPIFSDASEQSLSGSTARSGVVGAEQSSRTVFVAVKSDHISAVACLDNLVASITHSIKIAKTTRQQTSTAEGAQKAWSVYPLLEAPVLSLRQVGNGKRVFIVECVYTQQSVSPQLTLDTEELQRLRRVGDEEKEEAKEEEEQGDANKAKAPGRQRPQFGVETDALLVDVFAKHLAEVPGTTSHLLLKSPISFSVAMCSEAAALVLRVAETTGAISIQQPRQEKQKKDDDDDSVATQKQLVAGPVSLLDPLITRLVPAAPFPRLVSLSRRFCRSNDNASNMAQDAPELLRLKVVVLASCQDGVSVPYHVQYGEVVRYHDTFAPSSSSSARGGVATALCGYRDGFAAVRSSVEFIFHDYSDDRHEEQNQRAAEADVARQTAALKKELPPQVFDFIFQKQADTHEQETEEAAAPKQSSGDAGNDSDSEDSIAQALQERESKPQTTSATPSVFVRRFPAAICFCSYQQQQQQTDVADGEEEEDLYRSPFPVLLLPRRASALSTRRYGGRSLFTAEQLDELVCFYAAQYLATPREGEAFVARWKVASQRQQQKQQHDEGVVSSIVVM